MKTDLALVSPAAAARLPLYVRSLKDLAQRGVDQVSSRDLADVTGLEAHQIRKDLSRIGNLGKRGVGYQVEALIQEISAYLRLSRTWSVALVGCGKLGSALSGYLIASGSNFRLTALFDCSSRKLGTRVGDLEIHSWTKIPSVMKERQVDMVVIATPAVAAQAVADLAAQGGARFILNFAPIVISVPGGVVVRNVDLANEMLALSLQTSAGRSERSHRLARPTVPWVSP